MADFSRILERRNEHRVLGVMLLLLYAALRADAASPVAAALMTSHLGLFFLWQPIWQRDQKLDRGAAALVILFSAAFIALLGWALVFAWLIMLIGIVAGRSVQTRRERYVYLLTLAFLISELLIECVPRWLEVRTLAPGVVDAVRLGLFAIPCALPFIPAPPGGPRTTFPIDFFRGITVALMTALLGVSSVLMTYELDLDYPKALILGLLALGGFLLTLGWLLRPATGSGLGALWEKSLMNIGTPFEAWIASLAALAGTHEDPQSFVAAAAHELADTPWVAGITVDAGAWQAHHGRETAWPARVEAGGLAVTIYVERQPGATLLVHCRLLVQILGHFYTAKRREAEQAREAHLKAIHETGARLTHDIKNLLQSLKLMTTALEEETDDPAREAERQSLLRRQVPDITRRLQLALDKLQQPAAGTAEDVPLADWWRRLVARYDGRGIRFSADIADDARAVPGECLDSVVENLLDNALQKRLLVPELAIDVLATSASRHFAVQVIDDGAAIAPALAAQLFKQSVTSASGLGIGLFQAARLAALADLRLALAENRDGRVVFELAGG
ncbi:MAG: HAMP domain-containing histidine kinase [Gammaproteobacteria bacterium]|nr:HAMP domain-containing histidine kinase [Gammaproteobacteria bacterium]